VYLAKALILPLVLMSLLFGGSDAYGESERSLAWVGNMYPGGLSDNIVTHGESFTVYTQVYKPTATDLSGRGENITCTLYWGEVDRLNGDWIQVIETPMAYSGDIGNNDEYRVTITPGTGLYEFTTRCSSQEPAVVRWQNNGNGHLTVSPLPDAPTDRRALWIDKSVIAWNYAGASSYELHAAADGNLLVPVRAGTGIPLELDRVLNWRSYDKFPIINGYDAWRLPKRALADIPDILRSEIAIAAYDASGKLLDATGVQLQGVLDALYSYDGELGVVYDQGTPTLKLWAPTAQSVSLRRFADPNSQAGALTKPMQFDPATGVWSIEGDPSWDKQFYQYEVKVHTPTSGKIETNLVTDPYSVGLSTDSRLSQILDLENDDSIKPVGWDALEKPLFTVPEDMAIYEVHVRDFSRDDPLVPPEHRGTFKAFTYNGLNGKTLSHGMSHLSNLAEAGLTHIHLLPVFDFASVAEDARARIDPNVDVLSRFAPDSVEQQAIVGGARATDSFNWGYDPYHYGVPEGSYTTNPDDATRILEFREMVQSLNQQGLRVVLDMVYNHTFANGLYTQAVLDRVVPGYYHRYTVAGYPHNSSCCADTAVEFDMMNKLMVDTMVRWAKAYKIDGFRFDLMNLHTAQRMVELRDRMSSLTVDKDGVNGEEIYIYGEGWDFGSARDNGFYHANQFNMAGTGIGTFNDKIRDALHGGYAGDSPSSHRQGFINGLAYDWNGYFYGERFRTDLRTLTDRLRVNLAGSLQNYRLWDQNNNQVDGRSLNGAGYTRDPQESINYLSKHDNETLYDLNMFKMPLGESGMAVTSMPERVRAQNLGLSLVGLSQGIPFYHMGSDMLRSKSLDRNSYDSGDWFNRVDFTYEDNNFGHGLPPSWSNQSRWSEMAPMLANPALKPTKEDILKSVNHLQEILKIRKSSKLFRLETSADIRSRLQFHNTGSNQKDGLIVMTISDTHGQDLDPNYEKIVVIFNASKFGQDWRMPDLREKSVELHPIQAESYDELVRTASFIPETGEFQVPGRTTAVFVVTEKPAE
ncbi:MAG: pullulanase-type alpha-1,6-glucosidase, partial [Leptolyngbya sp. SIO3F4]|nr:pullulanase-type alpha-1,6-glucosidase [Leptolyngbya sp. SIO3F4]